MEGTEERRTPIYSYPANYQRLFTVLSLGLTLMGIVIRLWIELDWVDQDSARETFEGIAFWHSDSLADRSARGDNLCGGVRGDKRFHRP